MDGNSSLQALIVAELEAQIEYARQRYLEDGSPGRKRVFYQRLVWLETQRDDMQSKVQRRRMAPELSAA
jgi:hypothetical protein